MRNLKRLHKGEFNTMNQEWQPDGSVIVTLVDNKTNQSCKFRVQNLYRHDEKEVDIDTGEPIA